MAAHLKMGFSFMKLMILEMSHFVFSLMYRFCVEIRCFIEIRQELPMLIWKNVEIRKERSMLIWKNVEIRQELSMLIWKSIEIYGHG